MSLMVLAIGIFITNPEIASAATGGSDKEALSGAYGKIESLLKGSFSKIVAAISLGFGLVGCVLRFNPVAIAAPFGVAIAAGVGPDAINFVLGATF